MDRLILQQERGELLGFWQSLFAGGRNPFDPDARGPGGRPLNLHLQRLVHGNSDPMSVRHFHDSLGWCAGRGPSGTAGLVCRGAIYRTPGFMDLAPRDRVGTSRSGRAINVHIEHTVQATQFHREQWPARPADPLRAVRFLMNLTPTTAMSRQDKGVLDRAERGNHRTPALEPGEAFWRPFVRYRPLGELFAWNLVTGNPVPIDATFDDHWRTLCALIELVDAPQAVRSLFSGPPAAVRPRAGDAGRTVRPAAA